MFCKISEAFKVIEGLNVCALLTDKSERTIIIYKYLEGINIKVSEVYLAEHNFKRLSLGVIE